MWFRRGNRSSCSPGVTRLLEPTIPATHLGLGDGVHRAVLAAPTRLRKRPVPRPRGAMAAGPRGPADPRPQIVIQLPQVRQVVQGGLVRVLALARRRTRGEPTVLVEGPSCDGLRG